MARYIDADEFFRTLGFYEQSFDENRDFSARQTILQIMHELEHAPTADVEEVVRCKDCKFSRKMVTGEYTCRVDHRISHGENDFCSYGERNLSELPTD